jgi:hypothetical protein
MGCGDVRDVVAEERWQHLQPRIGQRAPKQVAEHVLDRPVHRPLAVMSQAT